MDFTREPIIETVVTPKEGCKIVVRNSKLPGQEEYFVDALEVVSFGHAVFYRSLERPKSFLLPVADYEILEVREAKMVLKNATLDRSIKIGGGKEKPVKEIPYKEVVEEVVVAEGEEAPVVEGEEATLNAKATDTRLDKRRDRRRNYKKKRGREELDPAAPVAEKTEEEEKKEEVQVPRFANLLAPPPTLISETIARYKSDQSFSGVFYPRESEETLSEENGEQGEESFSLNATDSMGSFEPAEENDFGTFSLTPEEEAEIAKAQKEEEQKEKLEADNSFCSEPISEDLQQDFFAVQEEVTPVNSFSEEDQE